MAINYYDEALANKIQDWVCDPNIHIYRPEELSWMLQSKSDESKDKPLSLPFIALSRDTEINIENANKRPMTYDGMALRLYDNATGKEVHLKSGYKLNAIPMSLSYQLDIYTKRLVEATEYVRNFIFNLVNYPTVTITIPYNGVNLEHKSTIQVESQVQDNSDIPQRLYPGQFTRFTIRFSIDDAYLFSVVDRGFVRIDPKGLSLEVVDNGGETKEMQHDEVEVITL